MINQLEKLSQEERELVIDAPVLVALLIAGADNKIEPSEYDKTIRTIQTKAFSEVSSLKEIYRELSSQAEARIDTVLNSVQGNPDSLQGLVTNRLSQLNEIFLKLDSGFAHRFYRSLKNMAYHVATANHMILGETMADRKTKELMELPMLQEPMVDSDL